MKIIKTDDVDFDYIGLAYFKENGFDLKRFYMKIDKNLNKVVIDLDSIYLVAIIFRTVSYFGKQK